MSQTFEHDIAVLVTSVYAIMTLESIKRVRPDYDPLIVYIGFKATEVENYLEGRHDSRRTVYLDAFDVKSLFHALQTVTRKNTLCIGTGMLLLKEPQHHFPKLTVDHPYSTMLSREFMYTRRMGQNKSYKVLGIDVSDDQNPYVTFHCLDRKFVADRFSHLDTKFRFGPDVLVDNFFSGRDWVRHASEAAQACVVDFLPRALDPDSSVVEAYSYPFDIYSYFATKAKDWIPADAHAIMVRNGRRAGIVAPLRKHIKPNFVYKE